MKKALACLVVFSFLGIVGSLVVIAKLKKVKVEIAALDADISQVEVIVAKLNAATESVATFGGGPDAEQLERIKALPHADSSAPATVAEEPEVVVIEHPTSDPVSEPVRTVNLGGAPSCHDLGSLKLAVNRTPRAEPYQGELRVSWQYPDGAGRYGPPVTPCLGSGTYRHLTLGKFSVARR